MPENIALPNPTDRHTLPNPLPEVPDGEPTLPPASRASEQPGEATHSASAPRLRLWLLRATGPGPKVSQARLISPHLSRGGQDTGGTHRVSQGGSSGRVQASPSFESIFYNCQNTAGESRLWTRRRPGRSWKSAYSPGLRTPGAHISRERGSGPGLPPQTCVSHSSTQAPPASRTTAGT